MATLTASGIGSGLDVASIVSQLMQVERQPINAINTKETTIKSKISAYGQLSSALATLKTAATALNTPSKINAFKASFADSTFGSASATSSAAAGTYEIDVTTLAKAHTIAMTTAAASETTVVGEGSLQITSGSNSFSLTIDSSNSTLAGIRDAINNSTSNTSVNASVVTDSNGARLVLAAKNTGLSNAISVAVTPSGGTGLNQLSYTAGNYAMTQGNAAQNAVLKINGVDISSASNTISSAISGVTLNLTKANSSSVLTVSRDTAALTTAANDFAKAYSSLASTVKTLTAYDATNKKGSTLTGDGTTSLLMSSVRSTLSTVPSGVTGAYSTLAEVGISVQADGSMAVDSTKLQTAIDNNFNDLQSVLGGYGKAIADLATSMTNTNGVVTSRVNGLNSTYSSLEKQKERLESRMVRIQAMYNRQYSALDTYVAKMNSTSSYLTQQLAQINANS